MAKTSKAAGTKSGSSKIPIKNKWLTSIVSLLLGLGVGTTFGKSVLESAGIPASCVRTIQRADKAITTGKSVASNGKAALSALTALHPTDAVHLLGQAKDDAKTLIAQTKQFDKSRKRCNADRK